MITRPEASTDDNAVAELAEFDECEQDIEAADRNSYLVRGNRLGRINDKKLHRHRHNLTFEDYCDQRWELAKQTVYQLIDAAAFAEKVRHGGLLMPSRERHIRPLLTQLKDNQGYTDEDRIEVWRDVLDKANGARSVQAQDVEDAITRFKARRDKQYTTLEEWNTLDEAARAELLILIGEKSLNRQENRDIEWADWSWNPVSGCLHGCPYCYARDIAFSIYPEEVGFAPTLWPDRLTAPANQRVPDGAADNVARKNIFTCSMADLFGRWVPDQWIARVLDEVAANPQWNFLFLTKFPKRMSEFKIPDNAWMGTTVDLQARAANAEKAFEQVNAPIRWLSIEPMLEPLQFSRLDLFDWIVIGGASSSKAVDGSPATPAWNVPVDWLANLHQQARAANCAIYYKDNSGLMDTIRIREYPGKPPTVPSAPAVFDYLRVIPKKEQIG